MIRINNPAFNYEAGGEKYTGYRQTDPAIAAFVHKSLGNAQTVLNVGAGAGSYEPADKYVTAVEPSAVMRSQRKAAGKVPAIITTADHLPFDDDAFDATMAMVTVHHWPDIEKGLKEMRRVTAGPVVIMTFDPAAPDIFWNATYFPELIEVERARYPSVEKINHGLGGNCEIVSVPVPELCGWFSGSLLRQTRSIFRKGSPHGAIRMGIFAARTGRRICRKIKSRPLLRCVGQEIRALAE